MAGLTPARTDRRPPRRLGRSTEHGHVVVGMPAAGPRMDLVIAQQHAVRLAAGHVELLFVDLAEQLALIELDRPLEVRFQLAQRR